MWDTLTRVHATCPGTAAARVATARPGTIPGWQQITPALTRAKYPAIPASRSRHGRNRRAPSRRSRRQSGNRSGRPCRSRRTQSRCGRRLDHGRNRRNPGRGRRPRRNPNHSRSPCRLCRPRNPGPGRDRCPSRNPSQSRSPDRGLNRPRTASGARTRVDAATGAHSHPPRQQLTAGSEMRLPDRQRPARQHRERIGRTFGSRDPRLDDIGAWRPGPRSLPGRLAAAEAVCHEAVTPMVDDRVCEARSRS